MRYNKEETSPGSQAEQGEQLGTTGQDVATSGEEWLHITGRNVPSSGEGGVIITYLQGQHNLPPSQRQQHVGEVGEAGR